jgi:hypothetical protein
MVGIGFYQSYIDFGRRNRLSLKTALLFGRGACVYGVSAGYRNWFL